MAKGKLLAEGTYQFTEDGAERGHATWQISQLGHGGIIITSHAEYSLPVARTVDLTYEVDRGWAPVSLSLRSNANGEVLNSTQRAAGEVWTAQIDKAGEVTNYEVPFSNNHLLEHFSPLTTAVSLLRTRLPVGGTKDFDVVAIDPDSFVPVSGKERYECLAEEKLQVAAGSYPAIQYRMTQPEKPVALPVEFSADHAGIVLLYRLAKDEAQLTRYRKSERR